MWRKTLTLACVACVGLTATFLTAQEPDDFDTLRQKAIKASLTKVAPYVVTIETSGGTDFAIGGGGPGGGPGGPRLILKGTGPTTGLIVGSDGYVITSAFNFANKPSSIIVAVPGKKERLVAKAIATDQTRMLTLLKIDAKGLPVPVPAPKKEIRIGHTALAVGRTLAASIEQPPSVSEGIISALDRIWGKAIQTDAKVSPTNYGGPLVDLSGRVMGVLVPASPRAEGETAGFEWYDSGIGFAIPLEDINRILPRLKDGKDVKKGLLGVTMRSRDIYADEPVIASVTPGSAAERVGLKVGDIIKEIDGKAVNNYAQVLHQLGGKYEDDVVSVKVQRGKETITLDKVVLGGAVAAFNLPFLGILPMRDDPEPGVLVRYVFPKGPAETAKIKEGDRITKGGLDPRVLRPVNNRTELAALIGTARPEAQIVLEVTSKGEKKGKNVTVKLGEFQDAVPAKLPEKASLEKALQKPGTPPPPKDGKKDEKKEAKEDEKKEDEKPKAKTGLFSRTNMARDRTYWVYVPDDYNPNISYALLIWLHPVNKNKKEDIEKVRDLWEDFCSENRVIMVCPTSEHETGWVGSESEFIQEAARTVIDGYTIDRRRVVAHGMGVGGQMSFYLGFAARDLVRGVATTGAMLTTSPKERVPTQPLSFFLIAGEKDPIKEAVKASQEKLREHRYPVLYRELPEKGHQYFDDDSKKTFEELVRWIDSLDRI